MTDDLQRELINELGQHIYKRVFETFSNPVDSQATIIMFWIQLFINMTENFSTIEDKKKLLIELYLRILPEIDNDNKGTVNHD